MNRRAYLRIGFRIVFATLGIVLVAGLAAPKFQAGQYRASIQRALETALHRKVEFGEIRFNLFTGPGFSVENVTIGEDPELGAEPIAYVNSTGKLTAIPRLWSLWTGHLEFSSLRLDDAQINLSRTEPSPGQYRWNVERLMNPAIVAAFPHISFRNSRINFKAENLKSTVYLLDCDLDISPPSRSTDAWHFAFEGKPARTDRAARGSGIFTARGGWFPSTGNLDLNLQLDRSNLSDLAALIRGEDVGIDGIVSGKAHLAGPPSSLGITGRLNLAELHGWDQSAPQGDVWPLDISGRWNIREQQLKLDAGVSGKVAVHYLVEKYFSKPRWGVSISFQNFSVEPLVNVARHLGAPIPAGLQLKGQLDAAVGYSGSLNGAIDGAAKLHRAQLSLPGSAPVLLEDAQVTITHGHAVLPPTLVTFPNNQEATFEASYDLGDPAPAFTIKTKALNVKAIANVPLLSDLSAGDWTGELKYTQQQWSGVFSLSNTVANFPGLSQPITIASAEGKLEGARVALQKMYASIGPISLQGEYRYEPGANRPHRFRLAIPAADTAALEKLALPSLAHQGALFGFGKPQPPVWLKDFRADGTIDIQTLHAAAMDLAKFHSHLVWEGTHIALSELKASLGPGSLTAKATIDLSGRAPAYSLISQISGMPWKTGRVDAESTLETSGLGADTLAHLHSTGTFTGKDIIDDFSSVTGKYDLRGSPRGPRLNITDLRLSGEGEVLTGIASLQNDGTVLMQLANGTRQLKLNLQ